jgi:FixJ family two-component response regulator
LLVCVCSQTFLERKIGRIEVNEPLTKPGIITIVDDDEPLREALGSVMKASGYSTLTFASAEEFLASAGWQDTACLILDVRLPGMSGAELQKRLSDLHSRIPIVFVTAHGDAALRDSLMRAGAAGFLNKPVRSDALLKEIHAALKINRAV